MIENIDLGLSSLSFMDISSSLNDRFENVEYQLNDISILGFSYINYDNSTTTIINDITALEILKFQDNSE